MEKRFVTFLLLSFTILLVNMMVMRWLNPPPRAAEKAVAKADGGKGDGEKAPPADADAKKPAQPDENGGGKAEAEGVEGDGGAQANKPAAEAPDANPAGADAPAAGQGGAGQPNAVAAPPGGAPERKLTLGSLDEASPYRMLVTLTNRGAAIERIEMAHDRFSDLDNRSGYRGAQAVMPAPDGSGLLIQAVGNGTPAQDAGLEEGDILTTVDGTVVTTLAALDTALAPTKPGSVVTVQYTRQGAVNTATTTLIRKPLEVIRPEGLAEKLDQASFLLTLDTLGNQSLAADASELPGLALRTDGWEVAALAVPGEVTFVYSLPDKGLELRKIYRLAQVPAAEATNRDFPAYHLDFSIQVRNVSEKEQKVAYRLDGPTSLTTEGWWYSTKISRDWGGSGVRDVTLAFRHDGFDVPEIVSCAEIIDDDPDGPWEKPVAYVGVDAQYFNVALVPAPGTNWPARLSPLRVGAIPIEGSLKKLTNVSFRVNSAVDTLQAKDGVLEHQLQIFVGPKRAPLLANYGLNELLYYGWPIFAVVSRPMVGLLHFFYAVVPNYGIAIVLLTVLVRSCLFPLSRKQAQNAQKMQELQPEIKRLTEKYKNNLEARTKAQQELFKQHNFRPLAGCLPALIQLPIFLGLYRGLSLDVELRQAPLFGDAIRWCSNLSAPDMLWYWKGILPDFLAGETGWLGPYFNLLPCITIALFLWQQKAFMPPAADEQAAMQQKIMKYMMIFMGLMFFKVPAGLCIYFIASSLWGIAERKLMPKALPARTAPQTFTPPAVTLQNGSAGEGRRGSKSRR